MTSFSLPGLPSLFILRIPPASCMAEPCANARLGNKVVVTPKAESTEAHRAANVLRVKVEFIYLLLPNWSSMSACRSRQREAEYVTACGNRHILFAGDRVAHGGRADVLPGIEMPQRFATSRICGFKRAGIVPEKHQFTGGRHGPGRRVSPACLGIFPGNRIRLQVEGDQNLLGSFGRDSLYTGRVIVLTLFEGLRLEEKGFALLQGHEINQVSGLAVRRRKPVRGSSEAGANPRSRRRRPDAS